MSKITRRKFLHGSIALIPATALSCTSTTRSRKDYGSLRALSFTFFTDAHISDDGSDSLRSDTERQGLATATAHIAASNCAFAINGGDLISEGLSQSTPETQRRFAQAQAFLRATGKDVYSAVGNHDLHWQSNAAQSSGRELFLEQLAMQRSYHSFHATGYQFIILDSLRIANGSSEYEGAVDEEQLQWLRSTLSRISRSTPIVLVSHMPLATTRYQMTEGASSAAPANRVTVNSHEVLQVFDGYNLVLVLQGHLHIYEEIRRRNTLFLTGGALCGGWWTGDWLGTPAGLCRIDLKPETPAIQYFHS
jgi:3',5'-cyclic AMP phosphodiesterase CpdA